MTPQKPLFIDQLDQMRDVRTCLQLYSGGLDSRYFLIAAAQMGLSVVALRILMGKEDPDELHASAEAARQAGAEYVEVNAQQSLVDEFISPAIRFNARYGNIFPVCSSLSRPLMARVAVKVAGERKIDCIVHNATWVQNSAFRFNQGIRALAPYITIAVPFARCAIDREAKIRALTQAGIPIPRSGVYSVDANLWGRVIEAGSMDDPAVLVPEDAFLWTVRSDQAPTKPKLITLTFENGLPIGIDGTPMPLIAIIEVMNRVGGAYGIGRYNGFEDTSPAFGGIKNHEVRESPGACAILEAHLYLEQAILNQEEMRWKAMVDWDWTRLVVNGSWYSPLKDALDAFGEEMARAIHGDVHLEFSPGRVFVSGVSAVTAPCYWNVREKFEPLLHGFDINAMWSILDIPNSLRREAHL